MLAGHLDTVPLADNFPSRTEGDIMWGCGTSDMKSGTALALWLAMTVTEPRHDVTYFFYDCEEVEAERNGLIDDRADRSRSCSRPTSRSCSNRRTDWSKAVARAPCGRA